MNLELKLVRLLVIKLINYVYLKKVYLKLPCITKTFFSVNLIPIHHNNCKELFISVGVTLHIILL